MSLKSVNDILGVLEQQAKWQEQPFQRLLECWAEIVGAVVAVHTRPLSIQHNVLRVATSSAAWSQNMTFKRQNLLLKLNEQLPTPLVDIRFSTAEWRCIPEVAPQQQTILPQEHPSYLGRVSNFHRDVTPIIKSANTVFGDWAKTMQQRSHGLPLCPQCQCPTPPGELQRWDVCSFCAAKQSK
ncbi:DciA family protein [Halotia wernerae UHCC 0503]|nr:DciA family protein [Halotia wernerae UHCC 0503]